MSSEVNIDTKLDLLHKLYDIIHSEKDLWKEVAEHTSGLEYFSIDDTYQKMLYILEVIEKKVGSRRDIIELRAAVASLIQQLPQQAPSLSAAQ